MHRDARRMPRAPRSRRARLRRTPTTRLWAPVAIPPWKRPRSFLDERSHPARRIGAVPLRVGLATTQRLLSGVDLRELALEQYADLREVRPARALQGYQLILHT